MVFHPVSGEEEKRNEERATRSSAALLEEVVVTARKREENIQDTPLSISAFDSTQIEALKIRNLTNLAVSMPNVALDDIGTTRATASFSIRGLGVNSSIPSIDPTVGVFVDGVYMGLNNGIIFDAFDLENIEVLRGPQGTLFGRNVTGGAILLNTRKPGDEFEARVRTAFDGGGDGGLNKYVTGTVSGPLSPNLKAKVSAYFNDDDGWFENDFDGKDFGELRQTMVRPVVVWQPNDNFEFVVRYEYTETDGHGPAGQSHTNGAGLPGQPVNNDRDSFNFSINEEGYQDTEAHFVAAQFDWRVGDTGTITNIFGWRDFESRAAGDVDSQPVSLFHFELGIDAKQVSNELRYNGLFAERLNVTAGLYYFHNEIGYFERRNLLGALTPDDSPAQTQDGGGNYEVETFALFTSVDYDLTETWILNAGVRYTYEDKSAQIASLVRNINSPCNVLDNTCAFDFVDDDNWANVSPKAGMTYILSEQARVYGFWTRGFRSGGYNLRNTALDTVNFGPGPFDEEQVDSFEMGVKTAFARGRLNGAVFYTEVEDMQREVNLADPNAGIVQVIKNTADADILGIELDGVFSLTENLTLFGSLGWIDADYDKVFFDLNDDGSIDSLDKKLKLPRAAEWTYNVGFTHDLDVASWGYLTTRMNYAYRDNSAFTDNNLGFIRAQDILDAGLDFHAYSERWVLSIYGRNLLNEVKHGGDGQLPAALSIVPLGGTFSPLAKGRVVGAELSLNF